MKALMIRLSLAAMGLAALSNSAVSLAACPASLAFGPATQPVLPANPKCLYGSSACLQPGQRHTGIDYPGVGKAIAIAAGTVVRVEAMNANDHGLGTNVLVRHVLPGCATVYSSYSHLASLGSGIAVNKAVAKGQVLGVIGGSGNGRPNAFAPHLHLEMKSTAVAGNPFGAGNQNKTCAADPLNAKPNTCWRYVGTTPDDYGYLNPADYVGKTLAAPVYRQVSAAFQHACVLKVDNTLACWGDNNSFGQATPPAGRFKQVSAGEFHTCALKADNTVACWGRLFGTVPAGRFKQVSAGVDESCALKTDNTLTCWGGYAASLPTGSFRQASSGLQLSCAIRGDGSLACWGSCSAWATPVAGPFKQVSMGDHHACGIRLDGTLYCWGGNDEGQTSPPAGSFKQVSAGYQHTCAIAANNAAVCWGYNAFGQATPPTGNFKQLSAGGFQTCGLRANNTLACWGFSINKL